MSKKIKQQLESQEQVHVLENGETRYLNDLITVQKSMNDYFMQLHSNYMRQVIERLGYTSEDAIEVSVNEDNTDLTIKRLTR